MLFAYSDLLLYIITYLDFMVIKQHFLLKVKCESINFNNY